MDRGIIYPGQVPLETDLLFAQKASMVGLAKLAAALLGTATFANGLTVVPNSPAALNVLVNPGEIYSLVNMDSTAYSSIAADTSHQIVKQGISLDQVTLACAAPGTAGMSINYLIEAAFAEVDASPVVLPYYNASNPATAYSGPANAGTTQNTRRMGQVALVAKAGVAAATGSQTTPSADSGYVGLCVVTVAYGQTQITAGNISAVPGAPLLPSSGIVAGGFQGNFFNIASAAGTADAITAVYTPGISALSNGMTLYVRAALANATTTPTFTPASGVITAKTIVKGAGSALAAGDIAGAGHWIELQYDLSLDKWVLLNPATGVVSQNYVQVQRRQTVLSGPVDSNGAAAFGGSTGSNSVTASGTLVATAANGFGASGAVDRVGSITNPTWNGLSTNGTLYLYLDIAADGSCTTGKVLNLPPNYQPGGTYSAANNQFTFNWQEMVGKVGNGSAANQVWRVFVGEVTVSGGVVSAITWYALLGRFFGVETSVAASGSSTVSHKLGVLPNSVTLWVAKTAGGARYRATPGYTGSSSFNGQNAGNINRLTADMWVNANAYVADGPDSLPTVSPQFLTLQADRGW